MCHHMWYVKCKTLCRYTDKQIKVCSVTEISILVSDPIFVRTSNSPTPFNLFTRALFALSLALVQQNLLLQQFTIKIQRCYSKFNLLVSVLPQFLAVYHMPIRLGMIYE